MKKFIGLVFAAAMILSVAFIGEMSSGENPSAAKAQTSVRRKRSGGLYGKSKRGVRYVYRGGKRVAVYTGRKTYQGGKYVGKKSVQGTKYVTKKTVNGTKSVFSKTKKVVVGN